MTMCIASVCDGQRAIVAVSDNLVTFSSDGLSASDYLIKHGALAPHWRCMFAGTLADVTPIVAQVRSRLKWAEKAPFQVVAESCEIAYAQHWQSSLNGHVMRRFGTTYEDYIAGEVEHLDPQTRTVLAERVLGWETGLDFLVYGFDEWPHIMTVTSPGKATNYDTPGFWAVGYEGSLQQVVDWVAEYRAPASSLPEAIIRLCEAKWWVDGKDGIGRGTHVSVLSRDDEIRLHPEPLAMLRYAWDGTHLLHGEDDWKQGIHLVEEALARGERYSEQQRRFRENYEKPPGS